MTKPKQSPQARDTLFGDVPIEAWVAPGSESEPWLSFDRARVLLAKGEIAEASALLRNVTLLRGIESRHQLQAWHFLRALGSASTPDVAKQVLGVVVEAALDTGLDVLAAYADRTARYYNYSGAAVIWDGPDSSLNDAIDAVLDAARAVIPHIAPWEGPRRPPPPRGHVRLNILTPSGTCFGEGPFDVLSRDAMAGRLLTSATQLMQRLTALPRR